MTAFEMYYIRYQNIMKWLPEVLEKEFRTIDKYGHLLENHIKIDIRIDAKERQEKDQCLYLCGR